MELDEKQRARLELAESLLELAEHSSEAEMRTSLSRIYYAVYHVAVLVVGMRAHGEMGAALGATETNLGKRYKRLHDLRSRADYDPTFLGDKTSIVEFRLEFQREMSNARDLYEDVLKLDRR